MTRITTPWDGATDLFKLDPGTVTLLVSLPTAGRTTLALNIATHAAFDGRSALFSSAEINAHQQMEKVFSARYGVNTRNADLTDAEWAELKPRAKTELDAAPITCHGASTGSHPRDVYREGRDEAIRRGAPVELWVVDTIEHFTRYTDGELEWEQSLHQVRRIASEQQIAVLMTCQVVTDREDESIKQKHVPEEVFAAADTVMVLDRPGVYWTAQADTEKTAASVRQIKPWPTKMIPLRLEASLCRFLPGAS